MLHELTDVHVHTWLLWPKDWLFFALCCLFFSVSCLLMVILILTNSSCDAVYFLSESRGPVSRFRTCSKGLPL